MLPRHQRVVALVAFLAVALPLAGWTQASSPAPASYAGIYVSTRPLNDPSENLPDSIYKSKADGVYVRLVWSTIEPRPGEFDWSTLNREVERAVRFGKRLSVGVRTGGLAPQWLYRQGVQKSTFTVGPHGGTWGRCRTVDIPWPWDENYQRTYLRMMTTMSEHLRSIPKAYEALRIVKITGINQLTEELRLPAARSDRPNSCESNAIPAWQEAGYRPSKVIAAWERLAAGVAKAFPDKLLAIEVLDRNDFPAIDGEGNFARGVAAQQADVKAAIIDKALRLFPGRFAVQWDGLSAVKVAPSVLKAGKEGAVIGWQTNLFKGTNVGSGCDAGNVRDARPCTSTSYRAILENGIANGARYLEIWAPDAERFAEVVEAVRPRLH
jgi:hypothetical protein